MKNDRLRVPVDDPYVEALGRHSYVFATLATKRRRSKHREALDPQDEAWLRGEEDCGFTECFSKEKLRALWDEYGDKELFEWTEDQWRPVAKVVSPTSPAAP
jgi:hypothetical protein